MHHCNNHKQSVKKDRGTTSNGRWLVYLLSWVRILLRWLGLRIFPVVSAVESTCVVTGPTTPTFSKTLSCWIPSDAQPEVRISVSSFSLAICIHKQSVRKDL